MQLTQKHIIGISIGAILALLGYFTVQNNTTSQLDGIKISTVSQSGIETDSAKRLKTFSESGTAWSMSPFGSGKPLEEEQKLEFKKPNTEWKTRQVTLKDGRTLTYVFGEGNPKEVALDEKGIQEMSKKCVLTSTNELLTTATMSLMNGLCNPENEVLSYITPEIEKHLLAALSDPNWIKLATECENHFRAREGPDALTNASNNLTYLIFDRVFASGFLDIERFISIDPTTGLKVLNNNLTINLAKFVMNGMYDGASRGEPQPNPYGDCVDRYGKDISRNLVTTTILYDNSLRNAEGIIHEVFTEFTIPFSFH